MIKHQLNMYSDYNFIEMFNQFLIKFGLLIVIMSSLTFYGIYNLSLDDKNLLFMLSLISIFGFGCSTLFMVKNIFSRIRKFTKNTENMSDNKSTLLKIEKNDELGQLGNSINKLNEKFLEKSENYEAKISELQIIDDDLKHKVQHLDETKNKLSKTIEELTVQKEIEKKHLSELEWRSKIVKNLVEETKKADQQKSEFSSMISHELKTPLTPITSWCSILEENVYGVLTPKQLASIKKIHENADKLVVMIGDLLDAGKLELGQMSFTLSDLSSREIVQSVYDEYEIIMKENNIDFSMLCEEDFIISADKIRIEQVLKNLLINAIDFVPTGGKIQIFTKRNDPYVTFCVKDNGMGISKENQKNLFKKFYQVNTSATRTHGGSGLGLAICRGIVRSMNGIIGVDSELGKGATFYFSLPVNDFAVPDPPTMMN